MEHIRDQLHGLKIALEQYDRIVEQVQQAKWFARMVEQRMPDQPLSFKEAWEQVTKLEGQRADALAVLKLLVPTDFADTVEDIRTFYLRFSVAYRLWGGLLEEVVSTGVGVDLSDDLEENAELAALFEEKLKAAEAAAKYLGELSKTISDLKV